LPFPIVPDSDVRAISVYFSEMGHAKVRAAGIDQITREGLATSGLDSKQGQDPDADLYVSACMSCHYNSGPTPLPSRPELALNSALTLSEPTNFIQAVLRGVGAKEGAPGLVMPEYATSLNDRDIAQLAAYLRRTRTKNPPWNDLENKIGRIRRASVQP
jgi:cytochrome c553